MYTAICNCYNTLIYFSSVLANSAVIAWDACTALIHVEYDQVPRFTNAHLIQFGSVAKGDNSYKCYDFGVSSHFSQRCLHKFD